MDGGATRRERLDCGGPVLVEHDVEVAYAGGIGRLDRFEQAQEQVGILAFHRRAGGRRGTVDA